jgi:hypothetical protein
MWADVPAPNIRPMTNNLNYHKLAAWSLPAAAVLLAAGALIDPAVDESTSRSYMAGLAEGGAADRYQVSALVLHFAFLCFVPAIVGLLGVVRRGALRTVGGVLGIMGAATLPGLVAIDYYDIALAQELSPDQAAAVYDRAAELPGSMLLALPASLGLSLGLILLFAAAWRSGVVPGWVALTVPVALVGGVAGGSTLTLALGGAVLLGAFVVTSLRLLRPAAPPRVAPAPA